MPAIPQTSTGMSSPPQTWRKGILVIANEVIAMVVTSKATIEAEEGEKEYLSVEEGNSQAGRTTSMRGRMTQFGHIARISTLPVAALLKTTLRSILAVRDSLAE